MDSGECDQPCPGNPAQLCGGANALTVVTAQCEPGWTRLGLKCLLEFDLESSGGEVQEMSIDSSLALCTNLGGNLFWPASMEELTFVKDTFW